eukprot:scaffold8903_cov89-Skeletonema_marinoi.AAC.5
MEAIPFDPDAPVQPTASMFSSDPYLALVDEEISQCLNFFVEADGDQASFMNVPSTTQNPLRYHWLFGLRTLILNCCSDSWTTQLIFAAGTNAVCRLHYCLLDCDGSYIYISSLSLLCKGVLAGWLFFTFVALVDPLRLAFGVLVAYP